MMSSPDSYSRCASVLYSEKLLGLRDDCNIPDCLEWESSTEWLLYDAGTEGPEEADELLARDGRTWRKLA